VTHPAPYDWDRILAEGCPGPDPSERLDAATALVAALTDPDTRMREIVAPSILAAWIDAGSYDDLLPGLGDGLVAGLSPSRVSAGPTTGTDRDLALHGRCGRAGAMSVVVARDNQIRQVPREQVLDWADRSVSWLLSERDVRASTPLGAADPIGRGAELVATLAASPVLGGDELRVLLDVLAERATAPVETPLTAVQADFLAFGALSILGRDVVDLTDTEAWVGRLGEAASGLGPPVGPGTAPRAGALALLGALHTQLLIGVASTPVSELAQLGGVADPHDAVSVSTSPRDRGDLVLAVQQALRTAAPWLYRPHL
jgi:hypothetical protein